MAEPTKEIPLIEEQTIEDGKVVIIKKEYTERTHTYKKGAIENYINEAKAKKAEAEEEIDKWEAMLSSIEK